MNTPISPLAQKQNSRRATQAVTALEVVVIVIVVAVLAGIILPASNCACVKGAQTKALAQAKQIGLALKLYAGDNNGVSPASADSRTSNDAFAVLFPTYTQAESIFGNKLSKYQSGAGPDNVIDNPYTPAHPNTLKPGENVYAYVAGLKDSDQSKFPLIADGTDGTGHYVTDQNARGGVWQGTKAVVIRLDNSGALETLTGPANARFVPRSQGSVQSLLDVTSYLGPQVRLLEPALPPAESPFPQKRTWQ